MFKTKPDPVLLQTLSEIAQQLPGVRWLAWLSSSGLVRASFPSDLRDTDRPAAMGAALLSLGERVSKELHGGKLHYTLIAGETGSHLLVVLDKENLLLVGLQPQTSIDALLAAARHAIQTHALQLRLAPDSVWVS